jgi:hypothetical protein
VQRDERSIASEHWEATVAHSYSGEYILRKAIKAARGRLRGCVWDEVSLDERANAIYREVKRLEAKSAAIAAEWDDDALGSYGANS